MKSRRISSSLPLRGIETMRQSCTAVFHPWSSLPLRGIETRLCIRHGAALRHGPHCPYEGLKLVDALGLLHSLFPRPHCPYEGLKPGDDVRAGGLHHPGPHCPYEGLKLGGHPAGSGGAQSSLPLRGIETP